VRPEPGKRTSSVDGVELAELAWARAAEKCSSARTNVANPKVRFTEALRAQKKWAE